MKTTTFITFVGDQCGKAKEAMDFYTSTFPNSEIKHITKYKEGEAAGTPNLVKHGLFTLNDTTFMISENNYNHAWSISPGVSIFVECNSENEIQTLFETLSSHGGQVMVPLDKYDTGDYGFGKKFGWCEDKFGVSWQLKSFRIKMQIHKIAMKKYSVIVILLLLISCNNQSKKTNTENTEIKPQVENNETYTAVELTGIEQENLTKIQGGYYSLGQNENALAHHEKCEQNIHDIYISRKLDDMGFWEIKWLNENF